MFLLENEQYHCILSKIFKVEYVKRQLVRLWRSMLHTRPNYWVSEGLYIYSIYSIYILCVCILQRKTCRKPIFTSLLMQGKRAAGQKQHIVTILCLQLYITKALKWLHTHTCIFGSLPGVVTRKQATVLSACLLPGSSSHSHVHLYSHSQPQTVMTVFRAGLRASSYLECWTACVNRDVRTSFSRMCVGLKLPLWVRASPAYLHVRWVLYRAGSRLVSFCRNNSAYLLLQTIHSQSFGERGERFSIWINYKCLEMSSIDKA